MFSSAEKQKIAAAIEHVMIEINHPEMPKAQPSFLLYVEGAEPWSWAHIGPNWNHADAPSSEWNEHAREIIAERMKILNDRGVNHER